MKIALDAMGSDNAPEVEVSGAILALEENPELSIVLVGKEDLLKGILDRHDIEGERVKRLSIYPAEEIIGMHEPPNLALRKKDSSIACAIELHKSGEVDGVVSAGNTGAVMAFALTILQTLSQVRRPSLATFFPTKKGNSLVLDIGANVDTKPIHLLQFGTMGSICYSHIQKKANPTVGLLNIGNETEKGNELTVATYKLLKESNLNFIGNIEGQDVLKGTCDVIICDGFVGNVMLKFGEGMVEIISEALEEYLHSETKYRVRRWFSKPVLEEFMSRMNYEEQGGGILLGVEGTVVIGHGRSTPKAIKNACRTAIFVSREKLHEKIRLGLAER